MKTMVSIKLGYFKGLETITDSKYIGWIHGDLQFDFLGLRQALEYLNYSNKMSDLIFYKGVRKGRKIFDSFFSLILWEFLQVLFSE